MNRKKLKEEIETRLWAIVDCRVDVEILLEEIMEMIDNYCAQEGDGNERG